MNPKVFVSHASEDKGRFVLDFARKLREKGIDAWLDRWEMLPGDSLVEKIFEEGLKEAQAIIVVLSQYSVNKPWVKEELNAGVINKISKGTKIIPIVLDECEVPESLKSTLWEKIADLSNYEASFDRIVASIYGLDIRPALGPTPSYARVGVIEIPGLTKIDNLVLKISCENEILENNYIVEPQHLFGKNGKLELPPSELSDSLEMLDQHRYIKLHRHIGPGPYRYQITLHGMDQYARTYMPNYQEIIHDVVISIVNFDLHGNDDIADKIKKPIRLINHILDLLENNGHLKLSKSIGGGVRVFNISPSLKRALK